MKKYLILISVLITMFIGCTNAQRGSGQSESVDSEDSSVIDERQNDLFDQNEKDSVETEKSDSINF